MDQYEVHSVRFERGCISNIQDGKAFRRIDTARVTEVRLRYGYSSGHPVLQLILGAALTITGLLSVRLVMTWIKSGGIIFDYQILFMLLLAFGIWMIRDALVKTHLLDIKGSGKLARIVFSVKLTDDEIRTLVDTVHAEFGISIQRTTISG
ncbi:MAG TPA: hypothetical protein PKK43_05090 [Spirochaetota bacterium]|nr:hypothetical protein [Spirochaetota bacterium]